MTYEKPKIRDFSRNSEDNYDPVPAIKLIPRLGFGNSDATIRDKRGWKIGGGECFYFRDTHNNSYKLLITPAVLEGLKQELRPFFGRIIPARLFLHIRLHDFPDEALDYFIMELFSEYWDEEEYDVIPPQFSKHEYHRINQWEYIIAIRKESDFRSVNGTVNEMSRKWSGKSTKKWNHVTNTPYCRGQFIFIFDDEWICDRVLSPQYTNEKGFNNTLDRGFLYAWYYGRYGVFDDWCHTEIPHNDYHVLPTDRW